MQPDLWNFNDNAQFFHIKYHQNIRLCKAECIRYWYELVCVIQSRIDLYVPQT